jgi:hypothetical protein
MPLEGHWDRQQTPLRLPATRGGRALFVIAGVLIVATVAVLAYVVLDDSGSGPPPAGCVEATSGTSTGGAIVRACGRDADRLCRLNRGQETPLARALRSQCDRLRARKGGAG